MKIPLLDHSPGMPKFSVARTFVFHVLLGQDLSYFIYSSKALNILNLNILAVVHR